MPGAQDSVEGDGLAISRKVGTSRPVPRAGSSQRGRQAEETGRGQGPRMGICWATPGESQGGSYTWSKPAALDRLWSLEVEGQEGILHRLTQCLCASQCSHEGLCWSVL